MENNSKDADDLDAVLESTLGNEVPDEVRTRLAGQLVAFRHQLPYHGRARFGRLRTGLRFSAAMAMAVLVVLVWAALRGRGPEPTWAQVAERFASVRFLSTTVYVKANIAASPIQLELWMGDTGRLRMLAGHEVFFGMRGHIQERIEIAPPPANEADIEQARRLVHDVIAALGEAEAFSLETLVDALPLQEMMATPLANQDARIAKDLVVFDMVDEDSPAWLRIWALRDSRLPVRMLYWDPRSGESVDAVLNYAHEQPPDFFDAAAFKAALAEGSSGAYALLKDPGGRPLMPAEL